MLPAKDELRQYIESVGLAEPARALLRAMIRRRMNDAEASAVMALVYAAELAGVNEVAKLTH